MAYIISVNSTIVSETGGTCVCPPESMEDLCATNVEYMQCVQVIKRDLVTATAAISALTTFAMGLLANMPIACAPGMGLNAYFAYTVVGYTAVFVEGLVFVALTVLGLRQWLARAIPSSIKLATGVGIGLYLTLIGLTYSAGIGAVTGATSTPMELAGCHDYNKDPDTGVCPSYDKMRNPTMWIGIFCGGFLTVFLMMFRVKGAIIMGILLVSIISWPRGTSPIPSLETADSTSSKRSHPSTQFRRLSTSKNGTSVLTVDSSALHSSRKLRRTQHSVLIHTNTPQIFVRRHPRLHWNNVLHGSLRWRHRRGDSGL
jgi:AGZA family xanthine/uracil permease-like MFS transporter